MLYEYKIFKNECRPLCVLENRSYNWQQHHMRNNANWQSIQASKTTKGIRKISSLPISLLMCDGNVFLLHVLRK